MEISRSRYYIYITSSLSLLYMVAFRYLTNAVSENGACRNILKAGGFPADDGGRTVSWTYLSGAAWRCCWRLLSARIFFSFSISTCLYPAAATR